jgi:hypothetical protein
MTSWRAVVRAVGMAGMVATLASCAIFEDHGTAALASIDHAADDGQDERIIVAVRDIPESMPGAGTMPRADYRRMSGYAGSTRSAALASDVAQAHGLREEAFWTIDPLHLRCMLYRVPKGTSAASVLARLQQDPRVQLAQPLNRFETLAEVRQAQVVGGAYNDPYIGLQHGFAAMGAAQAQRWTRGDGVVVALIDTSVDGAHPDLAGHVQVQRDFVGHANPPDGTESHGTEVAGIIAATANNQLGIVGMAPQAQLRVYRACWSARSAMVAAHCDSFTLARALGAAIADDADVINLSLGGPSDPLLAQLASYAIKRGAIVVGAVPPSGRLDGFPAGVPGVLAVASQGDVFSAAQVLSAPGRDVLTLMPGGRYDYASGSSLATAHVTGAVALLRALDPHLRADKAQALLERKAGVGMVPPVNWLVDVCAAVRQLRADAPCERANLSD